MTSTQWRLSRNDRDERCNIEKEWVKDLTQTMDELSAAAESNTRCDYLVTSSLMTVLDGKMLLLKKSRLYSPVPICGSRVFKSRTYSVLHGHTCTCQEWKTSTDLSKDQNQKVQYRQPQCEVIFFSLCLKIHHFYWILEKKPHERQHM